MELQSGKYLVYFMGEPPILMGEFEIRGTNIVILSDPKGHVSDIVPPGPITPAHRHRLSMLSHSGYWRILHESKALTPVPPSLKRYLK